jgi:hypothetical protein
MDGARPSSRLRLPRPARQLGQEPIPGHPATGPVMARATQGPLPGPTRPQASPSGHVPGLGAAAIARFASPDPAAWSCSRMVPLARIVSGPLVG